MIHYARKKHLYQVAMGVLFLSMLISALAWSSSSKAHAASASSILAVSVQPYQYKYSVYEVGQAYNQVIAICTDYEGPGDPIDATIDWGDKTLPTHESFIDSGMTFPLSGAHAYSQVGTYTVTVTISIGVFYQSATGTGAIHATPAYALNAKHITPTAGKSFDGIVATGTDPFPNDTITGTINWGDTSAPTSVTVTSAADGAFEVNAPHTYSQVGTSIVTLSLNSYLVGPISATGMATTTLKPLLYKLTAQNSRAKAGKKFCGTVATITGTISKKGLTVTINWGDGTTSTQTLKGGKGTFRVQACHTYANVVSYPVVIDTQDIRTGQTASAISVATVS